MVHRNCRPRMWVTNSSGFNFRKEQSAAGPSCTRAVIGQIHWPLPAKTISSHRWFIYIFDKNPAYTYGWESASNAEHHKPARDAVYAILGGMQHCFPSPWCVSSSKSVYSGLRRISDGCRVSCCRRPNSGCIVM